MCDIGQDVNPKELNALYPLYLLSMHVEGTELFAFGFPEIHISSLVLRGVRSRLLSEHHCQVLNLLPVDWPVICNPSYDRRVVSKFDDGAGGMDGGAVMSEEGAEEGVEDTTLWCMMCQCSGWEWMMYSYQSWHFVGCCWGSPVSICAVSCQSPGWSVCG